jgi:hypothetical protein
MTGCSFVQLLVRCPVAVRGPDGVRRKHRLARFIRELQTLELCTAPSIANCDAQDSALANGYRARHSQACTRRNGAACEEDCN